MAGCAQQVKAVTLELGGKSANVIFADADLEKAAACRALRRVRQRRAGLLRSLAHPRAARAFDRFMELLEPAVKGVEVGDPAARRDGDRAAHLQGPPRDGREFPSTGRPPIAIQGEAPSGPGLLVPGHGARPVRLDRPGLPGGDLRPGRLGHDLRGRGRRRSGSRTTPTTACPARSGPATSAAAIRVVARHRDGQPVGRTRTRPCATGRRSAATRSPASGRELGPGRPRRLHRDQERLHQHRGLTHPEPPRACN